MELTWAQQVSSPRLWGWPAGAARQPHREASSPRLWGWPAVPVPRPGPQQEFPTPVGMARASKLSDYLTRRVPHACGDGPADVMLHCGISESSPRLWGWPGQSRAPPRPDVEFPTPVGMARAVIQTLKLRLGVPHACGDGPGAARGFGYGAASSPRLWGWPALLIPGTPRGAEFPTPVGMARRGARRAGAGRGVPHACGDGPWRAAAVRSRGKSSPRLWGWPEFGLTIVDVSDEFPTPVGMARMTSSITSSYTRVPHACGDGPVVDELAAGTQKSSPRLWGWPASMLIPI